MSSSPEIFECAAGCGKSRSDFKKCPCQLVRHCSSDCQVSYRPQHKRTCKKRAAELRDEALFKRPPPKEDCPICFLMLPPRNDDKFYNPCCGALICSGCLHAQAQAGSRLCAFCRGVVPTTTKEMIKRYNRRVEANDANAMYFLGKHYYKGDLGLPRDPKKACELWKRGGDLGSHEAYSALADMHKKGEGVACDIKKAKHFAELAAMAGNDGARHNLACLEVHSENLHRAIKHFTIAAKDGNADSMKGVTHLRHFIPKEEYKETLREYIETTKAMQSENRDKAAEWNRSHAINGGR